METTGDVISPFAHRPLPDYHIRVVHILPSEQPGAPLECRIAVHSNQLERPEYEALSYAWGDPQDGEETILVDGQPFAIRLNLWLFLKQLRRDRSIRVVWANAICINQRNTEERNHQVKLMGDIYRHAYRTLIWLGPSSQASDELFEAIPEMTAKLAPLIERTAQRRKYHEIFNSLSESDLGISSPRGRSYQGLDMTQQRDEYWIRELRNYMLQRLRRTLPSRNEIGYVDAQPHQLEQVEMMSRQLVAVAASTGYYQLSKELFHHGRLYAELLSGFMTLSQVREQLYEDLKIDSDLLSEHPFILKALSDVSIRPYWKRLWIVQEIVLSRDIEVFCGEKVAPWVELNSMLRSCESIRLEDGRTVAASKAMALSREWQKRHEVAPPVHLEDRAGLRGLEMVLDAFETSLCTDVRDKVYGLLGLVDTPLDPDYSKSPLELFSQLMGLFKASLNQRVTARHGRPMSDLLHFGRLLQRTLRLDISGCEGKTKDDGSRDIIQVSGVVCGKVSATVSNVVDVNETAIALFNIWVMGRTAAAALPDAQKTLVRSSLLQRVGGLQKALGHHSDESFGSVEYSLFSSILNKSDHTRHSHHKLLAKWK